jgi:hypothetical protein
MYDDYVNVYIFLYIYVFMMYVRIFIGSLTYVEATVFNATRSIHVCRDVYDTCIHIRNTEYMHDTCIQMYDVYTDECMYL